MEASSNHRSGQGSAWRIVSFVLVVLLFSAAALVTRYRLSPKHFQIVEPGRLYRSASLPTDDLADVVERHGIRTVVNLRSELENENGDWYSREAATLQEAGVALIDLPMHTGHPPDSESLEGWLDLLADEEATPILVHCEYGVVRTSIMVSIFKMERHGEGAQEAWAEFELFGGELDEPIRSRLETYLLGYRSRRPDLRARAVP